MSHARTQIRNAVRVLLQAYTSVGSNVYESRIYPLNSPKLPAILIYTKEETLLDQSISRPRTMQRQVQLVIEIYAKASNNVDETIDNLAAEIEQLLGGDPTLNLYPEGDDSGDTYWTGDVIITGISYNASFDGLVEASFSFTGTGALTETTVA